MRRRAHDRTTVHHEGLEVARTPEDHKDATWTALTGAHTRRAGARHRDTGDLFQFVIQVSKICNSTKSQLSWKSPKIKVVEEL
jgi:hypothetical protein